ncbi:MAG: IPT/TIG domain-containing protein [Gammaproteobacteria bacterium]
MRFKHTLHIAGGLLVTAFGQTVGAFQQAPSPPPPVILTVAMDPTENFLVLRGKDFGSTLPTVYLGGEALPVKSFSSSQVVAALPAALPSAFYRLSLVNGTVRSKADDLTVEIAPSTVGFAQAAPERVR